MSIYKKLSKLVGNKSIEENFMTCCKLTRINQMFINTEIWVKVWLYFTRISGDGTSLGWC